MKRTANIIGASGLVGQQLLSQLLDHPEFEKVRSFVRRASGINHPRLEEIEIDFDLPASWKHLVQGQVLFSTLGTTIRKAKTQDNQYMVDYTYQYQFAVAAAENKVDTYVLVSSMSANSKSSFFYPRIKGELEEAVSKLGFKRLLIFRPSILDGKRTEKRTGEKIGLFIGRLLTRFVLKNYRPTPVDILAKKMIDTVVEPSTGKGYIIEGKQILAD